MTVVALVDDLLFLSRIREAARATGAEVTAARNPSGLVEACRSAAQPLVLVDLDAARTAPLDAVRALRADPELAGLTVVGFFSHVHAERAQEAAAAGVTRTLPRGAFVHELPRLLAGTG